MSAAESGRGRPGRGPTPSSRRVAGPAGPAAMRCPGTPQRAGQQQPARHPDDVVRAGAAQRAAHAARAEPRVGDHDDRAGPPAGVDRGGQVGAGGTSSATRSPGADAGRGEPGGEVVHPPLQQSEGHPLTAAAAARRRRAPGRRRGRPAPPTAAVRPAAGRGLRGAAAGGRGSVDPLPRVPGVLRRVLGDQVRGALVAVHLRPAAAGRAGRAGTARRTPGRAGPTAAARARRQGARARRRSASSAGAAGVPGLRAGCRRRSRRPPGAAPAVRYGAASASRTSRGQRRAGTARRPSGRRAGCVTQAVRRSSGACGPAGSAAARSRRRAGARRCWSARPRAAASRCRSAQPSEIGPPQSWPTVTTGPVTPERGGQRAEVVDPLREPARLGRCARRSPCRAGRRRPPASRAGPAASSRRHR